MINSQTCTEIFEIFELLGADNKEKIPKKFWDMLEKNRYKKYDKKKLRADLLNGIISEETRALYAALKYKYLSKDDLEKRMLLEIYKYNEKIKMRKDNNNLNIINDIFESSENKGKYVKENERTDIIEYKKVKWYQELFYKILKLFRKK